METPQHTRFYYSDEPGNNEAGSGNNMLDLSSLNQLDCSFELKDLSIKYVSAGVEYYNLDGRPYKVSADSYLIADSGSRGHVFIDSPSPVNGICIDLSASLVASVVAVKTRPFDPDAGREWQPAFSAIHIPPELHRAKSTLLGSYLRRFQMYHTGDNYKVSPLSEFFYSIAGALLADHQSALNDMQLSGRVKQSTRNELLSRLQRGKDFMDDCFDQTISIARIASESALSEYYFLRLFKKVFRQSPHQYLIKKRLEHARDLLIKTDESVSAIAYQSGFGNVQSFSKVFREEFGVSPSAIRKRRY